MPFGKNVGKNRQAAFRVVFIGPGNKDDMLALARSLLPLERKPLGPEGWLSATAAPAVDKKQTRTPTATTRQIVRIIPILRPIAPSRCIALRNRGDIMRLLRPRKKNQGRPLRDDPVASLRVCFDRVSRRPPWHPRLPR